MKTYLKFIISLAAFFCTFSASAKDYETLITRDGQILDVQIKSINGQTLSFMDYTKGRKGMKEIPVTNVFMILRDGKKSSLFFDESGNQETFQKPDYKEGKDNLIFMNDGQLKVAYYVTVGKDIVTYKLDNKKKAPSIETPKDEIFMYLADDGTSFLFNNTFANNNKKAAASVPAVASTSAPEVAATSTPSVSNVTVAAPMASVLNTSAQSGGSQSVTSIPSGRETSLLGLPKVSGIDMFFATPEKGTSAMDCEIFVNNILFGYSNYSGKTDMYVKKNKGFDIHFGICENFFPIRNFFIGAKIFTGIYHWTSEVKVSDDLSKSKLNSLIFGVKPECGLVFGKDDRYGVGIGYRAFWGTKEVKSDYLTIGISARF